jgi:hypothetical protein
MSGPRAGRDSASLATSLCCTFIGSGSGLERDQPIGRIELAPPPTPDLHHVMLVSRESSWARTSA